MQAIEDEAPPLARIISLESRILPDTDGDADSDKAAAFSILPSVAGSSANTAIPPDIALCRECLSELLNPGDRRCRYPFINCTNCGPRFTIVETIPYDRPKTSMKVFPMCSACAEEYHDPGNRSFHAQPNACPNLVPHNHLHETTARLQTDSPWPGRQRAAGRPHARHPWHGRFSPRRQRMFASPAVSLAAPRKGAPTSLWRSWCRPRQKKDSASWSTRGGAPCSPAHPIVLLRK